MFKIVFTRYILRLFVLIYYVTLKGITWLPIKRKEPRKKLNVLITGTFYSDNWLVTHLKPLAMSDKIAVVKMVSVRKVPDIENVKAIYPSKNMQKYLGEVPARLLLFAWIAMHEKPDIVAGFHLLLNGLVAILMAKAIGTRSLYICGGGPREVMGGGYNTESKIFNKLKTPDDLIESILIRSVNNANIIVSMGTGAVDYFKSRGVVQQFEIVPGGFDEIHFSPGNLIKEYDLILIGRLSNVKRVDIFLHAIKIASQQVENISAVIVGDGPDYEKLNNLSIELGLEQQVNFVGWQSNVAQWLQKSKVFVLTSESEGLSQALIQAMMVGLPAVVTNIGDLSDLVVNSNNGYLVDNLDPKDFAEIFAEIINNDSTYNTYSANAYSATRKYSYANVSKQWNNILEEQSE
ncbi:MAG: glycosyltransferase family 4 protein [Candidatus Thiodiazotropha sp. (ex Monitilora ramsayi)]|nr:glycosyltransferase family 4 protein [Candidatus Thiodiazotropha sp. (ex Monitilora ramsayi)]